MQDCWMPLGASMATLSPQGRLCTADYPFITLDWSLHTDLPLMDVAKLSLERTFKSLTLPWRMEYNFSCVLLFGSMEERQLAGRKGEILKSTVHISYGKE